MDEFHTSGWFQTLVVRTLGYWCQWSWREMPLKFRFLHFLVNGAFQAIILSKLTSHVINTREIGKRRETKQTPNSLSFACWTEQIYSPLSKTVTPQVHMQSFPSHHKTMCIGSWFPYSGRVYMELHWSGNWCHNPAAILDKMHKWILTNFLLQQPTGEAPKKLVAQRLANKENKEKNI